MSEAKHTPGPWTYEQRDGERHIHAGNGESLQCDARYYPWVSGNEADWHLIAAAPELLDALRGLLACPFDIDEATIPAAGIDAAPDQVVGRMSVALARLRKARAAIAKATGSTS